MLHAFHGKTLTQKKANSRLLESDNTQKNCTQLSAMDSVLQKTGKKPPPLFPQRFGSFFDGWGTAQLERTKVHPWIIWRTDGLYRPFRADKDNQSHIEPALGFSVRSFIQRGPNDRTDKSETAMLDIGATYRHGDFDFRKKTHVVNATVGAGVETETSSVGSLVTSQSSVGAVGFDVSYQGRFPLADVAQIATRTSFEIDTSQWKADIDAGLRLSLARLFQTEGNIDFGVGVSAGGRAWHSDWLVSDNIDSRGEIDVSTAWEAFVAFDRVFASVRLSENGIVLSVSSKPF